MYFPDKFKFVSCGIEYEAVKEKDGVVVYWTDMEGFTLQFFYKDFEESYLTWVELYEDTAIIWDEESLPKKFTFKAPACKCLATRATGGGYLVVNANASPSAQLSAVWSAQEFLEHVNRGDWTDITPVEEVDVTEIHQKTNAVASAAIKELKFDSIEDAWDKFKGYTDFQPLASSIVGDLNEIKELNNELERLINNVTTLKGLV